MGTIHLHLPDSLYQSAQRLAEKENVTLDQLISMAVAEKVAALMAEDEVGRRARRADADRFRSAMAKVARVEPADEDRL